ncbi:MAG TPA: hypothetical protein VHH88_00010 [Verrucomicrobiae bacterium]|nr:hypothetical protein [Verrucomicrobiae bacterium]
MRKLKCFTLALLLTGCATGGGRAIHQAQVDQLKPGTTTLAEMKAIFGKPAYQGFGSDGKLSVGWVHVEAMAFAGITKNEQLSAVFNDKDVLEKYHVMDIEP